MTLAALGLVILSALLHAIWNTITKGSRNPVGSFFGLELLTTVVGLPLILAVDPRALSVELGGLLAAAAVGHGLYAYCLTKAYETGELSLVYPISRSTPALTPIPAALWLGERLDPLGVVGIVLVLGGIWVIQAGEGGRLLDRLRAPGLRFAYWTLATTVLYSLVDKRAMALLDDSPWESPLPRALVYYWAMTAAHMPVFWFLGRRRLDWSSLRSQWRVEGRGIAIGAVCACIGYSLILEVLRTADVSYVVAARQTSVVFAVVLAMWWLHEPPSRARLVGAAMTVAGVALIGLT